MIATVSWSDTVHATGAGINTPRQNPRLRRDLHHGTGARSRRVKTVDDGGERDVRICVRREHVRKRGVQRQLGHSQNLLAKVEFPTYQFAFTALLDRESPLITLDVWFE